MVFRVTGKVKYFSVMVLRFTGKVKDFSVIVLRFTGKVKYPMCQGVSIHRKGKPEPFRYMTVVSNGLSRSESGDVQIGRCYQNILFTPPALTRRRVDVTGSEIDSGFNKCVFKVYISYLSIKPVMCVNSSYLFGFSVIDRSFR